MARGVTKNLLQNKINLFINNINKMANYVDNATNRRLGRVGMAKPSGKCITWDTSKKKDKSKLKALLLKSREQTARLKKKSKKEDIVEIKNIKKVKRKKEKAKKPKKEKPTPKVVVEEPTPRRSERIAKRKL
jgi:hypothetical protein